MTLDWKSIVSTIAPALGLALGGPLGGLAAKTVAQVLLGRPEATDDEMAQAVQNATPEQLLALKKADNDFKVQMRQMDIDLARIAEGDRDSARRREAEVRGWANPVLATLVISGFFGVVAYIVAGKAQLSGEAGAVIGTVVGYVSAKADQVIAYYFGSSLGSARKDETIKALAR
jgi:hypothetical protein